MILASLPFYIHLYTYLFSAPVVCLLSLNFLRATAANTCSYLVLFTVQSKANGNMYAMKTLNKLEMLKRAEVRPLPPINTAV